MIRYIAVVLVAALLLGCDKEPSAQMPAGFHKTELKGYTLLRDVKAGEPLEMAMLKPATIATKTLGNDELKDTLLTSAEIGDFLGKPFKKNASRGDLLEKELF